MTLSEHVVANVGRPQQEVWANSEKYGDPPTDNSLRNLGAYLTLTQPEGFQACFREMQNVGVQLLCPSALVQEGIIVWSADIGKEALKEYVKKSFQVFPRSPSGSSVLPLSSSLKFVAWTRARDDLGFKPEDYGLNFREASNIAYAFAVYDVNQNFKLETSELGALWWVEELANNFFCLHLGRPAESGGEEDGQHGPPSASPALKPGIQAKQKILSGGLSLGGWALQWAMLSGKKTSRDGKPGTLCWCTCVAQDPRALRECASLCISSLVGQAMQGWATPSAIAMQNACQHHEEST
eukprot:1158698-Pelagomonas_calceolata.AAC.2